MKKYILVLCLLFSTPVYAEDLITALGVECAKIIYNHSNWIYPNLYNKENSLNKQFGHLEKCLFLYKDNGGEIGALNKLYEKAKIYEKLYYVRCLKDKIHHNDNNEEPCTENKKNIWEYVMLGKECDLYTDENTFFINDILPYCKQD